MTLYTHQDISITIRSGADPDKVARTFRQALGEWEERAMYYDKHGTEIREGDTVLDGFKMQTPICANRWAAMTQVFASGLIVLSRADGTPVFRYADGRDVREGDYYRHPEVPNGHREIGFFPQTGPLVDLARAWWKDVTLIRRAGESEKPKLGKTLKEIARDVWGTNNIFDSPPRVCGDMHEDAGGALRCEGPPGHDGKHWCGTGGSAMSWSSYDSPILGHDRNGREVRRGDRVRNVHTDNVLRVERAWDGICVGMGFDGTWPDGSIRGVNREYAELVTDEKADTYAGVNGPAGQWNDSGAIVKSAGASAKTIEFPPIDGASSPFAGAPHALESLCRWLAQPTLEDRFEAIRAMVAKQIAKQCAGLDTAFVADKSRDGFLVRFWLDDFRADMVFDSGVAEKQIEHWVESVAKSIKLQLGGKVIRRSAALRKAGT